MPGKDNANEPTQAGDTSAEITEQILAAAQDEFELIGIRRASMSDIAKRAGLGRATVYRRFPGKDSLVEAVGAREMMAVLARVVAAISDCESVADAVVQIVVSSARELRENALLNRLLATEPEEVYSYAANGGGATLAVARVFILQYLESMPGNGLPDTAHVEKATEVMIRLAVTQLLIPEGVIPFADDAGMAQFARDFLVPIVTGATLQAAKA
ncbi:TetR/AcrR family transcriptional regulator [Nocardia sp. NPDC055321]